MIIIPDTMRRPAEVERDELRKQLAEAKAEIELLNKHWSRVEERLNGMLYHSDWNLDAAQTIIKRKDKLIEQMRETLRAWVRTPNIPLHEAIKLTETALGAAERGEG